jgi:Ribonuclease G/E
MEGERITVRLHPIVHEALENEERDGLIELEKKVYKKIILEPDDTLGVEQCDLRTDGQA